MYSFFSVLLFVNIISIACTTLAVKTKNKLIIEKAGVVDANRNYFSYASLDVQHYNDEDYGLNGEFNIIQEVPNSTVMIGKVYNYIDYQYEIVGETDKKKLCQFLKDEFQDWFPLEYINSQNIFYQCPIVKGLYKFTNFTPKNKEYPIAKLWTKSLAEVIFLNDDELLLHIKWYSTLIKGI